MKKLFLLLAIASWLLTSCTPSVFMQIATLSSDNVNLQKNGSFAYKDTLMTIEYDFWSKTGKFSFLITNNSDNDIYLNLSESYFVNNGYAYDYYRARTYIYANSYPTVNNNGHSVTYKEKPVVCIPAHSSKTFEEFNVATSAFRDCGFIRDPYKGETAVREFTNYSSPRVIENRLMFEMGDIMIPVTNTFYVSRFQNISYYDATEYTKIENCDGTKTRVLVNKMAAKNKFYITYNGSDLNLPTKSANDRTSNKKVYFGNPNKQNFNDDIYQ